jgi:mono/diheme cytochrome c family protein
MKHRVTIGAMTLSVAGLLCACTAASALASDEPPAPRPVSAPAAQAPSPAAKSAMDMPRAQATFEAVCSACHESTRATSLRNTRRGWEQVVDRMFSFGLSASDEQVAQVVEYLSVNFPPN